MKRIQLLLAKVKEKKLDGLLLVRNEKIMKENVKYISGFTGSTAYLVITPEKRVLLTDDRYVDQAKEECPGFEIIRHERPYTKTLSKILQELNVIKLGYEVNGVTMDIYKIINESLAEVELIETENLVESLRAIKEAGEIKVIKHAARIAGEAFEYILDYFKPGVSEKDLALEFEFNMRKRGADNLAFDLILVSGCRTTHQHGTPSEKKLNKGDFVVMDFGALYQGYCCDITRTFVIGKATAKQKHVYNTVKKAQQLALDLLKAGAKSQDVCKKSRMLIEDAGYGDYTGYGLGHGVGLEIHEEPYLRANSELILKSGHVVTVEPGIYIPGWGGVRIEDTIVIEENGCRILTPLSKELIEI